jgi:flagellar basal-body rod modification protein FlgD
MATVNSTQSAFPSSLTTSTTPNAPAPGSAQQMQSQFLQLLVAQLKGQNPLDPQDPTAFVTQLAQFSSLEQLVNIRTDLDGMSKSSAAATTNQSTNQSTDSSGNPFQGASN